MARARRYCIPGSIWDIRPEEGICRIAVGSRSFVENVKALLGFRAKGRDAIGGNEGYQLREGSARYKALFGADKDDIGPENIYFWSVDNE